MEESKYVRITTYGDNKAIMSIIAVTLIEERLAASTHTDKVVSSYWWKEKVVDTEEYRLEIITKRAVIDEVVNVIRKIHTYETPEIQIDNHYTLNKDIETWIDKNVR